MAAHRCRFVVVPLLVVAACTTARGWDAGPREDVGVAAVDTRTGKVQWEVWRLDELPADASDELKTAVEYLFRVRMYDNKDLPRVTPLPDIPVRTLKFKNPWPEGMKSVGARASKGKSLVYYRHAEAVIALDPKTEVEAWRLETTRRPYPSDVLEVGENQALIQIGSDAMATLHFALTGGKTRDQMRGLEPHTLAQRVAAATLLHRYGDGFLRPEVKALAAQLREEKDDPAAATAAKAVEGLLSDWPKVRDRGRYTEGLVATLIGAENSPLKDLAWKDGYRVLVWCVLQERLFGHSPDAYTRPGTTPSLGEWRERPFPLPDASRKKLVAHCREVLAGKSDREKPFAVSVLLSKAVGWAELTDAELKALFLSAEPWAWHRAGLALSTNGRRKDLLKWAGERPVDDHLVVISLLERDRKGWAEGEVEFWLACARRDLASIARALDYTGVAAPIEFRELIRDYVAKEAVKMAEKGSDTPTGAGLTNALSVLAAWKDDADTPLIQEFLKHPAVRTGTWTDGRKQWLVHEYGMRQTARQLLEKRGDKVPPGIIYRVEEALPAKK